MSNAAISTTVRAARIHRRQACAPVDFAALLGEDAWARLPLAVQRRFSVAATITPHDYAGTMVVRASAAGFVLAQLCRLFGTPLAPWRGVDVPVGVHVHTNARGELVWDRTYDFAGRAPVLVSSRKVMNRRGELTEVIRGGLGMTLALTVEDGALHFRSTGYFLRIGPAAIPIPAFCTPGRAHVIHEDVGGGAFRFTLRFIHPLAGEILFQSGVFRER